MKQFMVEGYGGRERIRFPVILFVLMIAASYLHAGEGKTPIWEPTTIPSPGNYIVTRDITTAAGPVLDILADGVTVDLNGFTLSTADTTAAVVHFAPPPTESSHAENSLALYNGKLVGGMYGVLASNSHPWDVEILALNLSNSLEGGIRLGNTGSFQASGVIIKNTKVGLDILCQPSEPCGPVKIFQSSIQADVGIQCSGVTCDIRNNILASCATAIRVLGALGGTASQNGISVPGSDVCFNPQPEPPCVDVSGTRGFVVTHNTIIAEITGVGVSPGIMIGLGSDDAFIMDNVISGFGGNGIQVLADDTMIVGNLVNRNGGHGLSINGSNNLMDGNKMASNGGDGMNVSTSGHVYRNNVLLGNTASLGGAGAVDLVDGGGNVE